MFYCFSEVSYNIIEKNTVLNMQALYKHFYKYCDDAGKEQGESPSILMPIHLFIMYRT